jgi:hypothetical protein
MTRALTFIVAFTLSWASLQGLGSSPIAPSAGGLSERLIALDQITGFAFVVGITALCVLLIIFRVTDASLPIRTAFLGAMLGFCVAAVIDWREAEAFRQSGRPPSSLSYYLAERVLWTGFILVVALTVFFGKRR